MVRHDQPGSDANFLAAATVPVERVFSETRAMGQQNTFCADILRIEKLLFGLVGCLSGRLLRR